MHSYWKRWLFRLLILAIIIGYPLSTMVVRAMRRHYLEHTFNAIPLIEDTVPAGETQRYFDPIAFCTPLLADTAAAFLTDKSEDEVLAFYEQYMQTTTWNPSPKGANYINGRSRVDPRLLLSISTGPINSLSPPDLTSLGTNANGKTTYYGINVRIDYQPVLATLIHRECPITNPND